MASRALPPSLALRSLYSISQANWYPQASRPSREIIVEMLSILSRHSRNVLRPIGDMTPMLASACKRTLSTNEPAKPVTFSNIDIPDARSVRRTSYNDSTTAGIVKNLQTMAHVDLEQEWKRRDALLPSFNRPQNTWSGTHSVLDYVYT